jgi:hypothetical protein
MAVVAYAVVAVAYALGVWRLLQQAHHRDLRRHVRSLRKFKFNVIALRRRRTHVPRHRSIRRGAP